MQLKNCDFKGGFLLFSEDQKNFLTAILMFECVKNGANRHYTNIAKTSIEKDFENLTRDEINSYSKQEQVITCFAEKPL